MTYIPEPQPLADPRRPSRDGVPRSLQTHEFSPHSPGDHAAPVEVSSRGRRRAGRIPPSDLVEVHGALPICPPSVSVHVQLHDATAESDCDVLLSGPGPP